MVSIMFLVCQGSLVSKVSGVPVVSMMSLSVPSFLGVQGVWRFLVCLAKQRAGF